MGWIHRWLGLCEHEWEAIDARHLIAKNADFPENALITVVTYTCTKCPSTTTRSLRGRVPLEHIKKAPSE